jgi:hypothetical protein
MTGDHVELRHDAHRALSHREVDVGAAQAKIGQLAVAHAMELVLGGAQLEVSLTAAMGAPDQRNSQIPASIMKTARA